MARRPLRVGSTFSGVGGADLGLERAGFQLAWTCEWDEWKRTILAAHWPDVPHYTDVRDLCRPVHPLGRGDIPGSGDGGDADAAERVGNERHDPAPVDVLCGGFPCQDLSVAGKRRGFDGERSVLAFEFLRVAESLRPRWLLLENVPGLLSSNGGRDLARLLDELGTLGYGWAYRIPVARYFGVPQRRRRVFIVARRTDPEFDSGAAAGLALRALWEGSGGDPTPGWPPREITTASVGGSAEGGGGSDELGAAVYRKAKRAASDQDDETWTDDGIANTLNAFDAGDTRTTHAVVKTASTLQASGKTGGHRIDAEGAAGGHLIPQAVAFGHTQGLDPQASDAVTPTLRKNGGGAGVAQEMSVRRLTPVECERLMGWPDNWTAPDGVKAPDSKRYAACGDGIVSWVAYWIGCRIQMIEDEAAG